MLRYIRAFFLAAKLTLRGESPPPRPYEPLRRWLDALQAQVEATYQAADRHGLDRVARQQIVVKADGREMSMQVILDAIAYHAREEYPYLLRDLTEHSITAIYASNMNDQFYIASLQAADALQNQPVQQSLARLAGQLQAIPPSTDLNAGQ